MNLTGQPAYAKGRKRKRHKATDRPYLDWLRTKPCCHCGEPPPSDPAHVRLGGRAGVGMKPLFSAVPLCHRCHARQHQRSHSDLMPADEWLRLADRFLVAWRARIV